MNDDVLRAAYERALAKRAPESRDACPAPEALLSIVERRGDVAEREAVLAHVATCVACQRDLDLLRAARGPIVSSWRRTATLAAAAVIVILAGIPIARQFTVRDSGIEPERSGAEIVLLAPRGDALVGTSGLTLTWRAVSPGVSYDVAVIDESGSVAWRSTTRDTVTTVAPGVALATGHAYYWTITARLPDGGLQRSQPAQFTIRARE